MKLPSLTTHRWHDQVVLVRVDYNVPLVKANTPTSLFHVSDPRRVIASFATINALLAQHNKVVLLSHFGRPTPRLKARYSLLPVFRYLQQHTPWQLEFIANYRDPRAARARIDAAPPQTVFLLENLRFHPGEETNDAKFIRDLATLGDAYVNDAFSASHRRHASVFGLAAKLPAVAGISLINEVQAFTNLLTHPAHPFVVIVGGAKISDKIDPIVNLARIADAVLIGGGVANNFLKAVGLAIQKSYLQDTPADLKKIGQNYVAVADQIISDNLGHRLLKDGYIPLPKIIYPVDAQAATSPNARRATTVALTDNDQICHQRCDLMYLDIGPKTTRLYQELIMQAATVFWNGPMGVYEKRPFARGTHEIARTIAKTSAVTVVGGGDTIAALDRFHYYDSIDYVSMAGSAALDFLSGKTLPGLAALAAT